MATGIFKLENAQVHLRNNTLTRTNYQSWWAKIWHGWSLWAFIWDYRSVFLNFELEAVLGVFYDIFETPWIFLAIPHILAPRGKFKKRFGGTK